MWQERLSSISLTRVAMAEAVEDPPNRILCTHTGELRAQTRTLDPMAKRPFLSPAYAGDIFIIPVLAKFLIPSFIEEFFHECVVFLLEFCNQVVFADEFEFMALFGDVGEGLVEFVFWVEFWNTNVLHN